MLRFQNQIKIQNKNQVQVSITPGNRIVYPDKENVKYKINCSKTKKSHHSNLEKVFHLFWQERTNTVRNLGSGYI